ncbi:DUF4244 domain-containing protein [Nocardioides aurantiacus]|uniref:Uncharacterized protein DUF4244 n=1 Tax=Nocardioides aurantiacus TaxID=86796 RepID=A0A3N2CPA3_9ACTN|nr:DUF4244 domain-containing protein [Nocardioides aurantiacus]ROR89342.1 uncharacterized protein DUF4244 [Nocardioides aurantiacus]
MKNASLAPVGDQTTSELPVAAARLRGEDGATTAEYATVTGAGVGFGALLFKFLTSDAGQELLQTIFRGIGSLLPF